MVDQLADGTRRAADAAQYLVFSHLLDVGIVEQALDQLFHALELFFGGKDLVHAGLIELERADLETVGEYGDVMLEADDFGRAAADVGEHAPIERAFVPEAREPEQRFLLAGHELDRAPRALLDGGKRLLAVGDVAQRCRREHAHVVYLKVVDDGAQIPQRLAGAIDALGRESAFVVDVGGKPSRDLLGEQTLERAVSLDHVDGQAYGVAPNVDEGY